MKAVLIPLFLFPFGLAIPVREDISTSTIRKRIVCLLPSGSTIDCGRRSLTVCQIVDSITKGTPSYWDDWDFELSAVVQGPTSISIDSLVAMPTTFTVPPQDLNCNYTAEYDSDIRAAVGGVSLTQDWAVYNNSLRYSVPAGQYGVLVINPWTARYTRTATMQIDPSREYLGACQIEFGYDPGYTTNWQIDTR
jgi:hypothetical protein